MRTSVIRLALAAVGLCAVAAPAAAQPTACPPNVAPQFCKYWDEGVVEWNRAQATKDFTRAKAAFEKALDFEKQLPGPYRYLADIARAEGKFEECLKLAVKAITLNPKSDVAPEVRKIHAECRKQLGRPDLRAQFAGGGAISVETPGIDGAKVKLNGLTMGATPFEPRPFAVGEVEVAVEKPGYIAASTTAEILPGLVTDVIFDMKEDPNAAKDPCLADPSKCAGGEVTNGWVKLDVRTPGATVTFDGKTPELDAQGRIVAQPGLHEATVTADGHDRWVRRIRVARGQSRTVEVILRSTAGRQAQRRKGWMALGAAAVLAGAGAAFGLLEDRAWEEAQDIWHTETTRPAGDADGHEVPLHTRAELDDARSRGKRWQILSLSSYGLAAAALGVSAWFFIHERSEERRGFPPPVAVTPVFIPGDSGVGLQATYTKEVDW